MKQRQDCYSQAHEHGLANGVEGHINAGLLGQGHQEHGIDVRDDHDHRDDRLLDIQLDAVAVRQGRHVHLFQGFGIQLEEFCDSKCEGQDNQRTGDHHRSTIGSTADGSTYLCCISVKDGKGHGGVPLERQ